MLLHRLAELSRASAKSWAENLGTKQDAAVSPRCWTWRPKKSPSIYWNNNFMELHTSSKISDEPCYCQTSSVALWVTHVSEKHQRLMIYRSSVDGVDKNRGTFWNQLIFCPDLSYPHQTHLLHVQVSLEVWFKAAAAVMEPGEDLHDTGDKTGSSLR